MVTSKRLPREYTPIGKRLQPNLQPNKEARKEKRNAVGSPSRAPYHHSQETDLR